MQRFVKTPTQDKLDEELKKSIEADKFYADGLISLLKAGANPNRIFINDRGDSVTPLMHAVILMHDEHHSYLYPYEGSPAEKMIEILLEYKADPNVRCTKRQTHHSDRYRESLRKVDYKDTCPLKEAMFSTKLVHQLLNKGKADPNFFLNDHSLIYVAAEKVLYETSEANYHVYITIVHHMLNSPKANQNTYDVALKMSIISGNVGVLREVLTHSKKYLNFSDQITNSAIVYAVLKSSSNMKDIVLALIENQNYPSLSEDKAAALKIAVENMNYYRDRYSPVIDVLLDADTSAVSVSLLDAVRYCNKNQLSKLIKAGIPLSIDENYCDHQDDTISKKDMFAKLELLLQELRIQRVTDTKVYVNILSLYEQLYSQVIKDTKNPSCKKILQEDAQYNLEQFKKMTATMQESEPLKTLIHNCSQTFFKTLPEEKYTEKTSTCVRKYLKYF